MENTPQNFSNLEKIKQLSVLDPEKLTSDQMEFLFETCRNSTSDEERARAAGTLSVIYEKIAHKDKDFAMRVHELYLRHLLKPSQEFGHPSCNWLAVTHLQGKNLSGIPWESVSEVSIAAEALYNLSEQGLSSDEINVRVKDLVKYAGMEFSRQDRWEDLLMLLCQVHVAENTMDADFYRLKNTVLLYEQRRVKRLRLRLRNFLIGIFVLVTLVSPALFLIFENKYRHAEGIEKLTFFDAVYWSIITAGTVGYGDIVPFTHPGRVLAMVDSLLVIVLLGVVAGLILSYLTPRNV